MSIKTKDMERKVEIGTGSYEINKNSKCAFVEREIRAMRINKNERCSFVERERDPVPSNKR